MNRHLLLALFICLVVGGGWAIGYVTRPDSWYAGLTKPAFNPPGWIFGPVWTALYVMIAIAGWRLSQLGHGATTMKLWWAQLALNFLWSPTFFAMHRIGLALVVIILLLSTVLALIRVAWPQDRAAALLLLPYAAWVAFATILNAAIFVLN